MKKNERKRLIIEKYIGYYDDVNQKIADAFNLIEAENLVDHEKKKRQDEVMFKAQLEGPKIKQAYVDELEFSFHEISQKLHNHDGYKYLHESERVRQVKNLDQEYERAVRMGDESSALAIVSEAIERGANSVIRAHSKRNRKFLEQHNEYVDFKTAVYDKKQKYEDLFALGAIVRPGIAKTTNTRNGPVHQYALPSVAMQAESNQQKPVPRGEVFKASLNTEE